MVTARLILLGVAVAQLADAVTFAAAISRYGIGVESNAWAVELFSLAGLDGVLLAKLAVVVTALMLLAISARRFPRLLVLGGAAATGIGLIGFVTNATSILVLG